MVSSNSTFNRQISSVVLRVNDDDEDGVNNGIDECPDTNEGEEVDEFGHALYNSMKILTEC